MKPHTANLLNAIVLIGMGAWGYFGSITPSKTALIPVFIGVLLLVLQNGVRNENKIIAHIVVVLTLLGLIGIAMKPFPSALSDGDSMAILRTGAMLASSALALIVFIMAFVAARKNK